MTPELITAIASLIAQLGPLGLELFLKLEGLMHLGPDEKANVANAIAAANASDDNVINAVSAWMKANGFVAQFVKINPPSQA